MKQPQRARGAAFDDAAAEPPSQVEGEVGAAPGLDQLPAPAQEVGVERACPCPVTGVELQVHDGPGAGQLHGHRNCDPRSSRNPSPPEQKSVNGIPAARAFPALGAAYSAAIHA
jgi:hypothetical protein